MTPTRQLVFHGAQSSLTLFAHMTAIGVTLLLIVMLLRYERRLVSKAVGNWLLGLRVAALAVVQLMLLQPVLSWTLDQTRTGRILVGIDLSESMNTTDLHAPRSEKLRWARGLGMIGNSAVDERLDQWQQAFDADEEPEWVGSVEVSSEERRQSLANSRREHLLGLFKQLDAIPRREIARRLLTSVRKPLLDELKPLGKVELFAFAGRSEAVERSQLEQAVNSPSTSLLTGTSDLSQGLQPGGAVTGADLMGVILLTDGRDHSGKNLTLLAASLKAADVPVFPVLLGSTYRPKDLSFASLEYPQAVYKGDKPQLKVIVNTSGFEGSTIEIELLREDTNTDLKDASSSSDASSREDTKGEKFNRTSDKSSTDKSPPLHSVSKKTINVNGSSANIEFDLDAADVGRKSFVIRTPVLEGETRDDNNSRSFAFAVVDDRAKVFLIDGDARWEFRYIDAALSRDDRVDFKRVLFQQPYLGVRPEPFFPRSVAQAASEGGAANNDPTASPFANTDLVILGDVPPQNTNDLFWEHIHSFVKEGGTLVISAGKRWMPSAFRVPVLDQLLPVTNVRPLNLTDRSGETSPQLRGLPLRLTVDGEQQPMLQFAVETFQNQNVWVGLPGQTWMMLGDTKPAATVWATTMIPANQADPLLADRKHAAIVHQYFGSGQVVWLGFDGTWRWRHRVGDEYHHRFWAQLARWAAANKVSAGNEFVRFGPEKFDIEVGQDAVLRAKWMAEFMQKFPKLKARVEFFRAGDSAKKPFTTIELSPAEGHPMQHEGKAVGLPTGEYRVALSTENADLGPKPIEVTLYVRDRPSQELSDVSANRDLLTQIADASGGRLFLPDELHELPRQFKTFEATTSQYEESPLWDRWPWLAILFALLMTEWVIRKLNGLP